MLTRIWIPTKSSFTAHVRKGSKAAKMYTHLLGLWRGAGVREVRHQFPEPRRGVHPGRGASERAVAPLRGKTKVWLETLNAPTPALSSLANRALWESPLAEAGSTAGVELLAAAGVGAGGQRRLFGGGEVEVRVVVDETQTHWVDQLFELPSACVLGDVVSPSHELRILQLLEPHLFF